MKQKFVTIIITWFVVNVAGLKILIAKAMLHAYLQQKGMVLFLMRQK